MTKTFFLIQALLLFLFFKQVQAQTAPVNDDCSGAITLPMNISCIGTTGSSSGATQSLTSCSNGGVADDDVWYKFTAVRKQHAIKVVSTAGFDAVLEVFSGSCGNLTSLTCTDATAAGQEELANVHNLVPGQDYYIRVYHYRPGSGSGQFSICVSAPNNDFCSDAIILESDTACSTTTGTLQNATESLTFCNAGIVGNATAAKDVWYKFTATAITEVITVDPIDNFRSVVEVFAATDCNNLNSLKCQASPGNGIANVVEVAPLIPGNSYYIRVYNTMANNQLTSFNICVQPKSTPAGSVCSNAIAIPAVPFNSGPQTTCGAGDFFRGNFRNTAIRAEEMIYTLTVTNAPTAYMVYLDKETATRGYGVSVYRGCPFPALAPTNFVGDEPIATMNHGTDSAMITLSTNGTYYFVVDKVNNTGASCGNYAFRLEPAPAPPVHDECINAISLTVGNSCVPFNSSSAYATQSREACYLGPSNRSNADDDVWFSFVAKDTMHQISIQGSISSTMAGTPGYFPRIELFSGSCGNLKSMVCQSMSAGQSVTITPSGLIIGQTYYIRVYDHRLGWGNGHFTICITDLIENDECEGAITLPVAPLNTTPVPLLASSNGATQSMPTCGDPRLTSADDDVWFKFTATSAYQHIKVQGLDRNKQFTDYVFDATVELFSGSCNTLNSMVCMNRFGAFKGVEEIRTNNLIPGNTYYLRVYEADVDQDYTFFNISVQEDTPPAPGMVCSSAVPIASLPFNSGLQSTCNSRDDYRTTCGGSSLARTGREYVFKLDVTNAPASYEITLSTLNTSKSLTVFNGCPSPAFAPTNCITTFAPLSTNPGAVDSVQVRTVTLTTNGTYYILVEDMGTATVSGLQDCGSFRLLVREAPQTPANDLCRNAILLPVNSTCSPVAGTSAGATFSDSWQGCSEKQYQNLVFVADDDVWYKFVATDTTAYIKVQGFDNYLPGLQLFSGTCNNKVSVMCSEMPTHNGLQEMYVTGLAVGDTFFIKVYEAGIGYGKSGEFTICITSPLPTRPAGATCATATSIGSIPFYSGNQTTCGKGNDYAPIQDPLFNDPYNISPYGYGEDYVYELPVNNAPVTYSFTLGGSGKWKGMRIYNGCPANLETPQRNTFGDILITGRDTTASKNYTFTQNGTYYIVIDSSPEPGCTPFTLTIAPPAQAPANDDCAGAEILSVTSSCTFTTGNTTAATTTLPANCFMQPQGPVLDVWYKFVVPNARAITATAVGSSEFAPTIELFSDTCGNLQSVECPVTAADSVLTHKFYNLTPGGTFYLRVYNHKQSNIGSNQFRICLTSDSTTINSTCAEAFSLPVNSSGNCSFTSATTVGTSSIAGLGSCSGNADDNAWFKFTATNSKQKITVRGSALFDPVVELRSGSCSTSNLLYCADNTSLGGTEVLEASNLTVGDTYYARVFHYGPAWGSGDFDICVEEVPVPPVNDECITATLVPTDSVCTFVAATLTNATQSMTGCSGTIARDVWFKFVAVSTENEVTVIPAADADLVIEVFSGTCNSLNSMGCRDTAVTGGTEKLKIGGYTPGDTYYVRVYGYNNKAGSGNFDICITSTSQFAIVPVAPASSIFCAGETFSLPFMAFGPYQSSNVFTAELSDSTGSFAAPVAVGSISSDSSGTITVRLPRNISGNNLRLRLTASAPQYISSSFLPITINRPAVAPQVTIPPAYCAGEPINPISAAGVNVKWYADSALTNQVGSGTSFAPPQNLTASTTYYVTQNTNGCESAATPVSLTIKPLPNASFTGLDTLYCASVQPVTLQPAVAGGTFSGSFMFGNTFLPAVPGTYYITYTVSQNGCTSTSTQQVRVQAGPTVNTGPDQTICSGETIQIGGVPVPGLIYNWSPVAGISNPAIANPTITLTNPTAVNDTVVKILEVTNPATGCTSTDIIRIIVKGKVNVRAGTDTTVCSDGGLIALNGLPAGGSWSGSSAISGNSFDPAAAGAGVHLLIYTNQVNGCTVTDTLSLTVMATPATPVIVASGADSLRSSVSGTNYEWYIDGTLTNFSSQSIRPNQPGNYQVVVWNGPCHSDTSVSYSFTVTGIRKQLQQQGLSLYPNPNSGSFILELEQPTTDVLTVELHDALGRVVHRQTLKPAPDGVVKEQLHLQELSEGFYLLHLRSGAQSWLRKVIIKR